MRNQIRQIVLAAAIVSAAPAALAALPIFGGPTFGNGLGATPVTMRSSPGGSAAEGYAVGTGVAYEDADPEDEGTRGYRWDAFGSAIQNLGNHIDSPFGSVAVTVYGVNRRGDTVGSVFSSVSLGPLGSSGTSAVRWAAGGNVEEQLASISPTGTPGGTQPPRFSEALAINAGGTAVGRSRLATVFFNILIDKGDRAVRWDAGQQAVVDLGTPSLKTDGFGTSRAVAITNAGLIAGTFTQYDAEDNDDGTRVARWMPGSTVPVALGTLGANGSGVTQCNASAVNAAGVIVGTARRFQTPSSVGLDVATRWDIGSTNATELNGLGPTGSFPLASAAADINTAGVIVGTAHKSISGLFTNDRAVRWTAGSTTAVELPVLSSGPLGTSNAQATAVNDSNVTVGVADHYAFGAFQGTSAVLWRADNSILDLNTRLSANSGWQLSSAVDVSNAGFITGVGTFDPPGAATAYQRAWMMLVPEAGTYGRGDANFDGSVNFDDLLILAQHYGETNLTLSATVADLDLGGAVNFDDLLRLAQNYGSTALTQASSTTRSEFDADWALARSMVPEPIAIVFLPVGIVRRRRK
jgi:hypothetical protein